MLVNIVKEFTLQRDNGSSQKFYKGPQHVTDDDHRHWYLQAHLEGGDGRLLGPRPGTWEYTQLMQAKEREMNRVIQEEAEAAAALARETQEARNQEAIANANISIAKSSKAAVKREKLISRTR
jgi:hypothetical protein